MSVPVPTGTFTVQRPGQADSGPWPGNADFKPTRRSIADSGGTATEARGRGMTGLYALQLDPGAWPLTEEDRVTHVESGRVFLVRQAAFLRGATGRLAHVALTADLDTNDRPASTVVDTETGSVLAPVQYRESPIGSAH